MSIFAKHPLLVFGAGVAVGFYAHKYRKEIIESAGQLGELGKDFVKQQEKADDATTKASRTKSK